MRAAEAGAGFGPGEEGKGKPMSNDPMTEDKIRELCGCDACDLCKPEDEDFGADCDEYEALQDYKALDDELRAMRVIVRQLAKCDPVWDGECVCCGQGGLNRFKDGPERHAADCAWRLAKEA